MDDLQSPPPECACLNVPAAQNPPIESECACSENAPSAQIQQILSEIRAIRRMMNHHFDKMHRQFDNMLNPHVEAEAACFRNIKKRLFEKKNESARTENTRKCVSNPSAKLNRLRNPATGHLIRDCPKTSAGINSLTGPQARRILEALEHRVPRSLRAQRMEVRKQLFST